MSVIFAPREFWHSDHGLKRQGQPVPPEKRTHVFIHHTVMVDKDDTRNTWENWSEIADMMRRLQVARPDLGLDTPYSFCAFCHSSGDLILCEGRGFYRTGAHSVGHNTAAFGIAFAGDFENSPAPATLGAQLAALGEWLAGLRLVGFPNLGRVKAPESTGRQVFAHVDIKATACPGKHLMALLPLCKYA